MVNTRSRLPGMADGHLEIESTTEQPGLGGAVRRPPPNEPLGGGPEFILCRNLVVGEAVLEEATMETRLRDSMMQAMSAAMAQQQVQQQEFFMKLLEYRDSSNRQSETMAENAIVGSGARPEVVVTEEPPTNEERVRTKGCSYKDFMRCNPKEFAGSDNPIACMYWLKEVEMAFESSECDVLQRVKFASQLLRGEALIWWNLTRSALTPEVLMKLTWPVFKKKIMDKYCNERSLDKLEAEFRNLKKGNLSVANYSKLFLEKLNLVGYLVPDERSKIKVFHLGLPANMRTDVRNAGGSTLQKVIEEALLVKDDRVAEREERSVVGEKRKWEGPSGPVRQSRTFVGGRPGDSRKAINGAKSVEPNTWARVLLKPTRV
ncbi:hypothetical protein L6452_41192 [Arctium lappa]|uniref:Uncharacterized protein n=1 Tax=Arctium lappa TaxID=4217 RepID=A0ACB8XPM4_ARCLA|nr:hypothetical protein L6452_41192 [Arctium lappa]